MSEVKEKGLSKNGLTVVAENAESGLTGRLEEGMLVTCSKFKFPPKQYAQSLSCL